MIIVFFLVLFIVAACIMVGIYIGIVHAIAYFLSAISLEAILMPAAVLTVTLIIIFFKTISAIIGITNIFPFDNSEDDEYDEPNPIFIPAKKINRRRK
jgi:hypothetical protein